MDEKRLKHYIRALQKAVALRRCIEKDAEISREHYEILCAMMYYYKQKINEIYGAKDDGQKTD